MTCAAIMLALMGLAPSVWVLLALRMIQGGLTGTIFAAQALVASAAPEDDAGRAMGLLQMSVYVGATMGPVFGGAVARLVGYRASFVGAGLLLAMATLIVLIFVREPERRTVARRQEADAERVPLLGLLAVPAFAGAVLFTVVANLSASSQFPVLPLYVQALLRGAGNAPTDTGWLLAIGGLAGAAGSYTAGRMHRYTGLRLPLALAIGGCAVLLVPQAFAGAYLPFLALRTLSSFVFGGLFALVGTLAALSSPARAKGAAFGLTGAASSLGFGAGPLLGGVLTAAFGIRPIFIAAAVLLVLGGTVAGTLAFRHPSGARRSRFNAQPEELAEVSL
jgi:DHA1 family multidrug resistance protein-like MFS transporter